MQPEYFSVLDANHLRLDHPQRPELQKGVVDFRVPEAYHAPHAPPRLAPSFASPLPSPAAPPPSPTKLLSNPLSPKSPLAAFVLAPPPALPTRTPAPLRTIFVLDASAEAGACGMLAAACEAVRACLYGGETADGRREEAEGCVVYRSVADVYIAEEYTCLTYTTRDERRRRDTECAKREIVN